MSERGVLVKKMTELWPSRRMRLPHPDLPGDPITVDVLWPRYLWAEGTFATVAECVREYRRLQDEEPHRFIEWLHEPLPPS